MRENGKNTEVLGFFAEQEDRRGAYSSSSSGEAKLDAAAAAVPDERDARAEALAQTAFEVALVGRELRASAGAALGARLCSRGSQPLERADRQASVAARCASGPRDGFRSGQ